MGMVMYLRAGSVAEIDAMVGDDDQLFEWVTDEPAWEADKLWWAALDLVFGPGGVGARSPSP